MQGHRKEGEKEEDENKPASYHRSGPGGGSRLQTGKATENPGAGDQLREPFNTALGGKTLGASPGVRAAESGIAGDLRERE